MNELGSSCEVPQTNTQIKHGSRVLRFHADSYRWDGVDAVDYKAPGDHWRGILRMGLLGETGESTGFHLRYFEIAPGGFSSLEKHEHEHAVFVLRGQGEVQLGDTRHQLAYGDTVYVAPNEVHQFRNMADSEPFGFLCIVDAKRDRPTLIERE